MEWERQRTYDFENGKEAGIEIGKEAGKEEKAIEAAKNALEMKLSPEQAAKISGLPLEKVLELQEQLAVKTPQAI